MRIKLRNHFKMKEIMRVHEYFLIMFILYGISAYQIGCNEKNTNSPNDQPLSYFPLALGNTWTYVPEDTLLGLPFQWKLTNREGDTVTLTRQYLLGSHAGTIKLIDRHNEIDILLSSQGAVPFYRFTFNTMWIHRDTWECDDSSSWIAVSELNPIVTPAGTFTGCLRIERRTATPCPDAGTMFEWFAPGVGLVRWDELNYYIGGPLTIYLKNYSVH